MALRDGVNRRLGKIAAGMKGRLVRILNPPRLEYAPQGWSTPVDPREFGGWNSAQVVAAEQEKWANFCRLVEGVGPLGFSHEQEDLSDTRNVSLHNVHITYGYVLALAAQGKAGLSVLDYGGGLGHYFQIGRQLLPGVDLQFSCKEVPRTAEVGRVLNPEVGWYADDSCLEQTFDLFIISSSLQYLEDWQGFLRTIPPAVGEYLYLSRIPVVEKTDSFVSVQTAYGTKMLHWQFNLNDLLQTITGAGFTLVREFVVGDRPYIKNAPEQCELRSWLFRKNP